MPAVRCCLSLVAAAVAFTSAFIRTLLSSSFSVEKTGRKTLAEGNLRGEDDGIGS
jgi:hypothetical protein